MGLATPPSQHPLTLARSRYILLDLTERDPNICHSSMTRTCPQLAGVLYLPACQHTHIYTHTSQYADIQALTVLCVMLPCSQKFTFIVHSNTASLRALLVVNSIQLTRHLPNKSACIRPADALAHGNDVPLCCQHGTLPLSDREAWCHHGLPQYNWLSARCIPSLSCIHAIPKPGTGCM